MERERPIPRAGEFYRHKKGNLYQIITVAFHSETMEPLVIYQALYDDFKTYARPLSMFLDEEDGVKRFKRVRVRKEETTKSQTGLISTEEVEEPVEKKQPSQDILIEFLDAPTPKDKYDVLCLHMNTISEVALDSIGLSLDFVLNSKSREGKIDEIKELLETKMKYESERR